MFPSRKLKSALRAPCFFAEQVCSRGPGGRPTKFVSRLSLQRNLRAPLANADYPNWFSALLRLLHGPQPSATQSSRAQAPRSPCLRSSACSHTSSGCRPWPRHQACAHKSGGCTALPHSRMRELRVSTRQAISVLAPALLRIPVYIVAERLKFTLGKLVQWSLSVPGTAQQLIGNCQPANTLQRFFGAARSGARWLEPPLAGSCLGVFFNFASRIP